MNVVNIHWIDNIGLLLGKISLRDFVSSGQLGTRKNNQLGGQIISITKILLVFFDDPIVLDTANAEIDKFGWTSANVKILHILEYKYMDTVLGHLINSFKNSD